MTDEVFITQENYGLEICWSCQKKFDWWAL